MGGPAAMITDGGHERVYEIAPTWRPARSPTSVTVPCRTPGH